MQTPSIRCGRGRAGQHAERLDRQHGENRVVADLSKHFSTLGKCDADLGDLRRVWLGIRERLAQCRRSPVEVEQFHDPRGGSLVQIVVDAQQVRCHHAGAAMPIGEIVKFVGPGQRIEPEQQRDAYPMYHGLGRLQFPPTSVPVSSPPAAADVRLAKFLRSMLLSMMSASVESRGMRAKVNTLIVTASTARSYRRT